MTLGFETTTQSKKREAIHDHMMERLQCQGSMPRQMTEDSQEDVDLGGKIGNGPVQIETFLMFIGRNESLGMLLGKVDMKCLESWQ